MWRKPAQQHLTSRSVIYRGSAAAAATLAWLCCQLSTLTRGIGHDTAMPWQVFISADPRVEAARAALQHCEWDAEIDRKLQVVRNTFR